jgi:hypothetical protein
MNASFAELQAARQPANIHQAQLQEGGCGCQEIKS